MDPQTVFCPNLDCPARGQVGQGNIGIHTRKEGRYICHQCHKTFSARKGTPYYRLRTAEVQVTLVLTLLAYGCPVAAIVAAFQLDERTVYDWQQRAGQHCEQLHEHLVQQPRDLGHVQIDEIRVKQKGQIVWLAMALQVVTRLWLGATLSAHRDESLLTQLVQKVRRCALCRALLVCVDGWRGYPGILRHVFREAIPTRGQGRPRLRQWDGLVIAQVVKQYERGHVIGIVQRVVEGTLAQVTALLQQSHGGQVINTAYIERLNATFRQRLAGLIRRGRGLTKQMGTLQRGVYLVGSCYNFCTFHRSLRVKLLVGSRGRTHCVPRTPAMAAGITDHRWTMHEVLSYHIPPPRWTPPKQRGRPSKERKALIQKWA